VRRASDDLYVIDCKDIFELIEAGLKKFPKIPGESQKEWDFEIVKDILTR
jgi:hypothetical protein